MRFSTPSHRLATVCCSGLMLFAGACAGGDGGDDPAIVTIMPGTGGSGGASHGGSSASGGSGNAGHTTAGGAAGSGPTGAGGTSTPGAGGTTPTTGAGGHAGEGTAGTGPGPGAGGMATMGTGGMTAMGTGGMAAMGTGGMPQTTMGGGMPGMGAGGDGAGGQPVNNGCDTLKFPSVELVTVPNAAMTAEYDALGVTGCDSPKCFLDATDLKSPDGTAHDIHVKVSPNFELYELVGTDVDPNGTGNVDPGNAYSTHVLLSVNLVEHLQKLRDIYGGPVSITSGFRSPQHQHSICQSICGADQCTDGSGAVTCAKNSRHMWGAAADMSLMYESAANAAGFAFVYHENGGTGPHLHVDMQSCQ